MNIYTASKIPSREENLGSPEFFDLSLPFLVSLKSAHALVTTTREQIWEMVFQTSVCNNNRQFIVFAWGVRARSVATQTHSLHI
jgi:hypothetical protein